MTAISKNIYTDKLDSIVNKYNINTYIHINTYHETKQMKGADVKPDIYIEFDVEHDRDLNFKVGDLCKNIEI